MRIRKWFFVLIAVSCLTNAGCCRMWESSAPSATGANGLSAGSSAAVLSDAVVSAPPPCAPIARSFPRRNDLATQSVKFRTCYWAMLFGDDILGCVTDARSYLFGTRHRKAALASKASVGIEARLHRAHSFVRLGV